MKTKLTLSLDPEVADRLKQYAFEQHAAMSAIVTRWVMDAPVSYEIDRRQMKFNEKKAF